MPKFRILFSAVLALLVVRASAQSVPTLTRALPAGGSLVSVGTVTSIDLRNYFSFPGVEGTLVQFDTALGKFNVELLPNAAPQNAANFLNYVQSGAYASSFLHRSAAFGGGAVSIIQGGGFTWNGSAFFDVFRFNPVPLEYNLPNARGTLAAARTSDVNSATSQWYFNVQDNSTALGPVNGGGYTVFGRVVGTGMTVVDAFAALPRVNAGGPGGAFSELPVRNYTSGSTITTDNLSMINSVSVATIYPGTGADVSVMNFTRTNSDPAAVTASIVGPFLTLTPVAPGVANVTVTATDTNGNTANSSIAITVLPPLSRSVSVGQTASFIALSGASAYMWERNGVENGINTIGLNVGNMQPSATGLYAARMTTNNGVVMTRYAVLGVNSTVKIVGPGTEFPNIFHPGTGFTYDQILLEGAAASVTADATQILRMSYIDPSNDIVQVEFSGPGTLSLVLDGPSGPAQPVNYNQAVNYMKGRAGIVLTGATADTHLSVFSVGRANAANQSLFRDNVTYDGWADIAFIAITSQDGRFGGLRAANTRFSATKGLTGVYAPDVVFTGPVFVGDIDASADAMPYLTIGGGSDVRITGGDLLQANGRAVTVSGISQLNFRDGGTSHGTLFPAQANRAVLLENGVDVTSQIVVNP